MATVTRLPGIQFNVVSPPAPLALVRMDIAVFVGFAASGPLQIPVAVEDIQDFEEIFGGDLNIAYDPSTRQPVYALLPSAVRAFFRNGGSRCWIIRVAGPQAQSGRFPIPGLCTLDDTGAPSQAYARARSEGGWSDSIAAGAALRSQTLELISFDPGSNDLRLLLSSPDDLLRGDLLRVSFGSSDDALWMFADGIVPVNLSPPMTGPGRSVAVDVKSSHIYWTPASFPSLEATSCERLTLDLFVQEGSTLYTLTDLGLAPAHPRYWANLPSDYELYSGDVPLAAVSAEAAYPRFPLAGEDREAFYWPLAIGALPTSFSGPDLAGAADAILRDGVEAFGSELFLDPSLAESSSRDVLNEAYFIRYQSPELRRLTGIHAAIEIDEATIICVPDAVQLGWYPYAADPIAPAGPSSPFPHPEWWHGLGCIDQQSIPLALTPPLDHFQVCDLLVVQAPELKVAAREGNTLTLTWESSQHFATFTDLLEEAVDPQFLTANVIYTGPAQSRVIYGRPAGDYYYRVRRQTGDNTSDYSSGLAVRIAAPSDWRGNPAAHYSNAALVDVQGALVRMCAARGDMIAVLALPQHYREAEAIAHAATLKAEFVGNARDASFGAIYHPWLIGREENDLLNLRSTPPDGATAGVMAKRSSQRGAWISPANQALSGVVDMSPPVARASRQSLQDASINLIRHEPSGFLCLCQLTLSDDPDLCNINVRRLLSFVRKTALRAGADYVFEPNSDEFRRAVERGFEALLDNLLVRGAFAGRTSREAFQVVTDSSLNTRQAADNGQFFVELRIAPSVPLRFLTVRLLQDADRTFVTEGGA